MLYGTVLLGQHRQMFHISLVYFHSPGPMLSSRTVDVPVTNCRVWTISQPPSQDRHHQPFDASMYPEV